MEQQKPKLKTKAQKQADLSEQIKLVERHLKDLQNSIKANEVLQYSKVQSLNLDVTKLLARAGNLCWE